MTNWQDILIAVGSVLFTIALIPAILSPLKKPPISTSLLTGSVLWSYVLAFGSLGLWYSAFTTVATASCWTILFFQSLRRKP